MLQKPEIISSRNNPLVKWAASLQDKRQRSESRAFLAEGYKLTMEAITHRADISHIFISQSKLHLYLDEISAALADERYADTEVVVVTDSVLEKISTENAPQGVISVLKYLDISKDVDIIYNVEFLQSHRERAILLCSVRDPGNLGSIIRSAAAFGVKRIYMSDDCADVYNTKAIRAAMGGIFKACLTYVGSTERLICSLRDSGRRVYAAELSRTAHSLSEISLTADDVFIIGNEGHGIPRELCALCDASVYIPILPDTESLNASVAAAVLMWEQSKL